MKVKVDSLTTKKHGLGEIQVQITKDELGLILGMLDGGWYGTKQEEILHGFLQKVEYAGSPFQLTEYLNQVCYGKGEENVA